MRNQKGQALLETIVLAPFFKIILVGLFGLSYAFISFYYIDFQAYQAALCLEKGKAQSLCENHFREHIRRIPFSDVHNIYIYRNGFQLRFESELSTLFLNQRRFTYEWRRPLRVNDFGVY